MVGKVFFSNMNPGFLVLKQKQDFPAFIDNFRLLTD